MRIGGTMDLKNVSKLFILGFLIIFLAACGGKTYDGDFSFEIGDFTFTNQAGENLSKSDLDGEFWIASFIFTNCETVCPPMTANKAYLQELLKEEGLDNVALVSFSVDPERDTPEALEQYGEERGVTFDTAHFLTGYEYGKIKDFSREYFKSDLAEEPDSDQISHTVSFFIVSPEGDAITRFDGTKRDAMEEIVDFIKKNK